MATFIIRQLHSSLGAIKQCRCKRKEPVVRICIRYAANVAVYSENFLNDDDRLRWFLLVRLGYVSSKLMPVSGS